MKISETDKLVIIDMYTSGLPLRLIASWFNVSHVLIAIHLDNWGIKRRNGDQRANCNKKISGRRFGKLQVLTELAPRRYPAKWIVQCDCGNIKYYTLQQVKTNRSCGCGKRGPRRKDS